VVVADLCARLPEFGHINPRQVLLCMARARRSASGGGTYAKIVPMRFPDASPLRHVGSECYSLPQIPTAHGYVLYLIYVYLPRFYEQPPERRLLTLIHELYHIAPAFDGTIRRFGSRAHGASRTNFNAGLQPLVNRYLASAPPEILDLIGGDIKELARRATLIGRMLPMPKTIRLT
jgi:hypothetical protein